jgi:hypothetical protein
MNANRTADERTLGVDVVYLNESLDSFVLVQYKKLKRSRRNSKSTLSFRPDANLPKELERMRRVDALSHGATGPFRLLHTPCWLKLTEPSTTVSDAALLLKGMYLARQHFESLLLSLRGPRGGIRLGYDNSDMPPVGYRPGPATSRVRSRCRRIRARVRLTRVAGRDPEHRRSCHRRAGVGRLQG